MSLAELLHFLDSSPSPYHAARSGATMLAAAGFVEHDPTDGWRSAPSEGYVVRDGALVAWRHAIDLAPDAPFRIVGAHTDSPGLRIKPRPDTGRFGWLQLGVEVYGGILNNTWLDRDLGVAGRVVDATGTSTLVRVDRAVARIPQLAVHLDRNVNDGGLVLNRQQHLSPVWGLGDPTPGAFANWLAQECDLDTVPVWWDLGLVDVQPATVIGADRSLLTSGRLDNQLSCWASIRALADARPESSTALVVLNDHEEVGSASPTGASGPLLEQVIEGIVLARGGGRGDLLVSLARSSCVSADNAHAVHPNYPDRHDGDHAPTVGAGPAVKSNANQRYATSASTAAAFVAACDRAGVPHQVFVSRNDMPCGSTIGPLTATRLGIETADVGVPQLSMHSARELCGVEDPIHLSRAATEFLSG